MGGPTGSHTLRVITEGVDRPVFSDDIDSGLHHDQWHSFSLQQRRMTLFSLANANTLAIMTLRTVGVEPPVYIMTSATYAHCIRFLSSLFLAMYPQGDSIGFCKFYSDFFAAFSKSNFGKLYITGFLKAYSLLL